MKIITYTNPIIINDSKIPKSYHKFIATYGYGTYCNILNISEPDDQVIYSTFSGFDLWEFDELFPSEALSNAIQLGTSIDGDILCFISGKEDRLFILPRHAEIILNFNNLDDVFEYYRKQYQIDTIYFEPWFNRKTEVYSLIHNNSLLDIHMIHDQFIKTFQWDYSIGEQQPKYVIKEIGGWVRFDFVYKNSITISYQDIQSEVYQTYLDFIKTKIEVLKNNE
ncbi:hypothetical protein [Aquimarina algicola]|uniref:SMI1/KNR4 family protein n=1 Tax=Aquimarina algicola TaxID=2589995 RepID=A0A504JAR8_9FLAO|nr:hypothetical protein [Aquimarina algicola]TPN83351.1 hypothetical protein FHK87_19205 [Aquimarina algicola]